jgi:hypothetical protein
LHLLWRHAREQIRGVLRHARIWLCDV